MKNFGANGVRFRSFKNGENGREVTIPFRSFENGENDGILRYHTERYASYEKKETIKRGRNKNAHIERKQINYIYAHIVRNAKFNDSEKCFQLFLLFSFMLQMYVGRYIFRAVHSGFPSQTQTREYSKLWEKPFSKFHRLISLWKMEFISQTNWFSPKMILGT